MGDPGGAAPEEARVREIVLQVLGEALRTRGLRGVVISGPPCPESRLLARWLEPTVPVRGPPDRLPPGLVSLLEGDEEAGHLAWSTALARQEGLLRVHPGHKSTVLLDAPPAPCFPLGDLWAHELEPWCGPATRPRGLEKLDPEGFRSVEVALRDGLEGALGLGRTLGRLPAEVAELVRQRLASNPGAVRPPLIPKLSSWTPGLDPPP